MGAGASSRAPSRADISRNPSEVNIPGPGTSADSTAENQPKSSKEAENKSKSQGKDEKKNNQGSSGKKESPPPQGTDIMISYSHADMDFMKKLKDGLEKRGISVWVDITGLKAGVDFLSKIGQAIIDAKMFVQLLSTACVKSKYCQDELALAYVSNKPIFPVGIESPQDLFPKMDTGMKLQLARFNWSLFLDPENFEADLEIVVQKLQAFKDRGEMETSLDKEKVSLDRGNSRSNVNRHLVKRTSFGQKLESMTGILDEPSSEDFWSQNFKKKTDVPWKTFVDTFSKQYGKLLSMVFGPSDKDWLERIIHRELITEEQESSDLVIHESYIDFCTVEGEQLSFWQRVQDQAVESYTMKEVFDMNSSVRVEAIENLGKFRSKPVVEALLDLLRDKDNNIRAVAAISLARTGENSPKVIKELLRCLNDKDRLVREGACLALGHLKAETAVTKILHLWRNDFISSVREAAQVALEQIGGTEANKAMYITKVLSEEIRELTQE